MTRSSATWPETAAIMVGEVEIKKKIAQFQLLSAKSVNPEGRLTASERERPKSDAEWCVGNINSFVVEDRLVVFPSEIYVSFRSREPAARKAPKKLSAVYVRDRAKSFVVGKQMYSAKKKARTQKC